MRAIRGDLEQIVGCDILPHMTSKVKDYHTWLAQKSSLENV
jgi:hypothetical protein